MNMAMILTAIISGFIGGVLGAMVLHEILDQKFEKKRAEDAQQYAIIQHKLEQGNARYKTVTVALEQLTRRFVRDRGAIWESLNGLWNDYDDRHNEPAKAEELPVTRHKSDEKRTKKKQLLITEKAFKNIRDRAGTEDAHINECINALVHEAMRTGMKVHREKKAEPKTFRQIFVLQPSFEKEIEATAKAQGVSLNEYICFVLENCVKEGKESDQGNEHEGKNTVQHG